MRVALVTQFFPPETLAGANRVAAIADALAARASLLIVAPAPSYPDPSQYGSESSTPVLDGARIRRTRPVTAQRRAWPVRAAAESAMAARLARIAAQFRPSAIVASSPSMFLGPASIAAARIARAKFIWDLRDLTWEYGKEGDVIDGMIARRSLDGLARVMWATAAASDLVVCATDGVAGAVRDRLPGARVETVRNGIDAEFFATFDPSAPNAPTADGPTRVLYAGLIGHAQDLDVLVDVATLAQDFRITLAGDGPRRAALQALVEQRGLENVSFTGYVTPRELVRLYHSSDVLFAQLRDSELHSRTALPSKLLEYMAAARPIVYAGAGAAASFVEETASGVVAAPGDAQAIVAAVRRVAASEGREMGERGRAYVSGLPSRSEEMRSFAQFVEEVAGS
jgi:putative colanic acid biosynthesis glycosyltransferase WcaI